MCTCMCMHASLFVTYQYASRYSSYFFTSGFSCKPPHKLCKDHEWRSFGVLVMTANLREKLGSKARPRLWRVRTRGTRQNNIIDHLLGPPQQAKLS